MLFNNVHTLFSNQNYYFMKNLFHLFAICMVILIVPNVLTAQQNLVYQRLQNEKNKGVRFELLENVFSKIQDGNYSPKQFANPQDIGIVRFNPNALKNAGKAISLKLPLINKEVQLDLIETSIPFNIVLNENQKPDMDFRSKHYRGVIKDDPNSIVALSIFGDEIMGMIANKEGNYNIAFDKRIPSILYTLIKI